jgi:hypothetical protein
MHRCNLIRRAATSFLPEVGFEAQQVLATTREEEMRSDLCPRLIWLLVVPVLWLFPAAAANAQSLKPLPYTEDGVANGAPYEIIVPANWNATGYTLVVFAHGYNMIDCPLQPPIAGQWFDDNGVDAEPVLLGQGYALAASSYSQNGWAVKQGFEETRDLIGYFKTTIGTPGQTILVGCSMGTQVELKFMEDPAHLVDGAITTGDHSAGAPRLWDFLLAATLAYDVAFADTPAGGWDPSWGPFANPRTDLLYCSGSGACNQTGCAASDPIAKFNAEIADPANFGRFEFIRLVLGLTHFTTAEWLDPSFIGGAFQFIPAYVMTEGLAEVRAHIEADLGMTIAGGLAQNLDHEYTLDQDDIAHLATLGVDAPTLLAEMNARRIYERDPLATAYENAYFNPTGKITGPEILMKDIGDPFVPPAHNFYYLETLAGAGTQNLAIELFRPESTPRGRSSDLDHCGFFVDQLTESLAAMRGWIASGEQPNVSWPSFGFRPFTPVPFPYLTE